VRPLFEGLRGARSVLAFDLPGFGLSERRNISYDSLLFRDAISTIVARSRARHQRAADVVALGPSSELAAAAALDAPDDVRSLTLVAPTGFHTKETPAAEPSRWWNSALGSFLGGPLFSLIASPPSIRRHLAKSFVGPVDRGLLDYACLSARLPGASAAPLAFLAGRLSDPDVRTKVYERLTCPVQVIFDEDPYGEPEELARAAQSLGWTATRIERTRGMPQFEQTERTLGALVGFWNRLEREDQRMALSGPHQPGWVS
jgi:pimeloyl-ACP methyl ester carboxylesterase